MNRAVLICFFMLFPIAGGTFAETPGEKSPRHCRVEKRAGAIIAECRYPRRRLAFVFYSNKDYYMGEWNGKRHGLGLMKTQVRDAKSPDVGWYVKRYVRWRNGSIVSDSSIEELDRECFDTTCEKRFRMIREGFHELVLGKLKRKRLHGPGIKTGEPYILDVLIGRFVWNQLLSGECIFIDWRKGLILHMIHRKGKPVRIF